MTPKFTYIDEAGDITPAMLAAAGGRGPLPAKFSVLPGLPGGAPLLPSEREVATDRQGELVIFDGDDVVQALRQLEIAGDGTIKIWKAADGTYSPLAIEAMKTALMFGLSIAAVNVGVR